MNFLSEVGKYSVDDYLDFFRRYKYFHMLNKVKSVQKYGFQIDFYEDEFLESNSYHFYKIIIYDIETKRVQYQNFIDAIIETDPISDLSSTYVPNEISSMYVVLKEEGGEDFDFNSERYYMALYCSRLLEYHSKVYFHFCSHPNKEIYVKTKRIPSYEKLASLNECGVDSRWSELARMRKNDKYETSKGYKKLSEIFAKEYISWGSTLKSFFGLG